MKVLDPSAGQKSRSIFHQTETRSTPPPDTIRFAHKGASIVARYQMIWGGPNKCQHESFWRNNNDPAQCMRKIRPTHALPTHLMGFPFALLQYHVGSHTIKLGLSNDGRVFWFEQCHRVVSCTNKGVSSSVTTVSIRIPLEKALFHGHEPWNMCNRRLTRSKLPYPGCQRRRMHHRYWFALCWSCIWRRPSDNLSGTFSIGNVEIPGT